jgi:hypothetical protein
MGSDYHDHAQGCAALLPFTATGKSYWLLVFNFDKNSPVCMSTSLVIGIQTWVLLIIHRTERGYAKQPFTCFVLQESLAELTLPRFAHSGSLKVVRKHFGPSRIRTCDQGIMSPLL